MEPRGVTLRGVWLLIRHCVAGLKKYRARAWDCGEFIEMMRDKQRGQKREAKEIGLFLEEQFHEGETKVEVTREQVTNGGRGMPGLPAARKDAASCEKARGSASMK